MSRRVTARHVAKRTLLIHGIFGRRQEERPVSQKTLLCKILCIVKAWETQVGDCIVCKIVGSAGSCSRQKILQSLGGHRAHRRSRSRSLIRTTPYGVSDFGKGVQSFQCHFFHEISTIAVERVDVLLCLARCSALHSALAFGLALGCWSRLWRRKFGRRLRHFWWSFGLQTTESSSPLYFG
jgi:hypothetical protein